MIKVIQVITDSNIGGAGIWLLNYLKFYNRDEFDVSVILPQKSELQPKVEALGVRCIEAKNIADKSFSLLGTVRIFNILKKESPDIVHTHASLSARIAAKILKIKAIHTRHCMEDKKGFLKEEVSRAINNWLSYRIIGVSRAVCENLLDEGILYSKVKCVYNGIEPLEKITAEEIERIKEDYKIASDKIVVGMVARLEEVKNHEMFIEVAKLVSDARPQTAFMIVGTGTREEKLKRLAAEKGIADRVVFTGYIDDVNDIMNVIDIHVLTSKKEALCISLIEGMSLSKPIVTTASGGPEELVCNQKNGKIIAKDDILGFAEAVIEYIDDEQMRKEAGEIGKNFVDTRFKAANMARLLERIYKDEI